jgi:hypothetical protein
MNDSRSGPRRSHGLQSTGGAVPIPRRQPGTSGWAVAALTFSVAICPPLCLIGVLLGIKALQHVAAVPGRRGRGMAVAAIVLGLVATAGWTAAATWWHLNARRPMLEGPRRPLAAGLAGDPAAFQAGFAVEEAGAGRPEAEAFLAEVGRRYGGLVTMVVADRAGRRDRPVMQNGRVTIPYSVTFTDGRIDALASFLVFDPATRRMVLDFEWLVLLDADRGHLAYPASALAMARAVTEAGGPGAATDAGETDDG